MPLSMYSLLTSCSSEIIWVRYSLLMKGLEIPMVKGPVPAAASVAGISVAEASVAAGGSVAGACVAAGAWVAVAGEPQATIMEAMVIMTVTSKTSFLLLVD